MTSLEIATVTGKQHKHLMRDIRNMETAWEKVNGSKFGLVEYRDAKGELRPCYSLTKTECLYIATKFNDEARARLVLRWQELEIGKPFGLDGRDLNSFLCDQGIIQWAKGQWIPTRKFMNQGLTENRSFVIHGRNGHRRTVSRLVWTAKGRDFIMNIIKH
jgi:phage antirepressor YoqD-like protein